jgi:hypothetical protein
MQRYLVFALVTLVFLVCAPIYGQDMQLIIDDNVSRTAIFDVSAGVVVPNLAGCAGCVFSFFDYDAPTDTLTVRGNMVTFNINSITAQGGGDNSTPVHQNLTQTEASSSGAGTLTVLFTDTDYDNLGNPFSMSGTITNNVNSSGSSVLFEMGVGPGIPAAPIIGGLPVLSCVTTGTCQDGATTSIVNPGGTTGNLTAYKNIDFMGAGTVQTTLTITSVIPEPTSIALLGTMLLGAGFTLRRKFGSR